MRADHAVKAPHPWYRQGWPWFLIAIPAVAVISSLVTVWIAVKTADGLVVDDYYQEGKAIEKTMARTARAAELGLSGLLSVRADELQLQLSAAAGRDIPANVIVTLAHPTRAGMDQVLRLQGQAGVFAGPLAPLTTGRWQIQIEDEARSWRMSGTVQVPAAGAVRIDPSAS